MTSLLSNTKQNLNDQGYFISVASLIGKVYGYQFASSGSNSGVLAGTFSTASWAYGGPGVPVSTVVAGAGVVLKDLGKTVVSSLRTFRKVQLVLPTNATQSTFGVGGQQTSLGQDYLTGYIELGFEGNGTPAPVAHFGR